MVEAWENVAVWVKVSFPPRRQSRCRLSTNTRSQKCTKARIRHILIPIKGHFTHKQQREITDQLSFSFPRRTSTCRTDHESKSSWRRHPGVEMTSSASGGLRPRSSGYKMDVGRLWMRHCERMSIKIVARHLGPISTNDLLCPTDDE